MCTHSALKRRHSSCEMYAMLRVWNVASCEDVGRKLYIFENYSSNSREQTQNRMKMRKINLLKGVTFTVLRPNLQILIFFDDWAALDGVSSLIEFNFMSRVTFQHDSGSLPTFGRHEIINSRFFVRFFLTSVEFIHLSGWASFKI